jgi:mannose-6-phosphate isomerase-like protein (cupin superfamily)
VDALIESLAAPSRGAIDRLGALMAQMPQVRGIETTHHFCDGMYLRYYRQPPQVLVVSKVHKRENFFIVARGRAWISGDGETREVAAGMMMITPVGTKRAVLTRDEEVVIITVHRVGKERRLAALEARLVEPEEALPAMLDFSNQPKAGVLVQQEEMEGLQP